MTDLLLTNAAAVSALMLAVWLISLPLRDVSIIDLVWGLGFVLVAWVSWWTTASTGPARGLLVALTMIWGLRLSGHLAWRNHGRPEDKRYAAMRTKWGSQFPLVSLVTVFGLQGAVMWLVSLPIQFGIAQSRHTFSVWHALGITVWAIGLFFEAVGDWQLARFRANPANQGQVLDRGLWRYTRHPNYFGDFCIWWGLFAVSIAGGGAWWTVVSPLLMSILLRYFSGVTLLEKGLQEQRPGYAEYVQRTNAFWPGWPG